MQTPCPSTGNCRHSKVPGFSHDASRAGGVMDCFNVHSFEFPQKSLALTERLGLRKNSGD